MAVGTSDPHEAADRLLDRGVELALVKMGGEGVLVATADGATVVPPHPVEVVCGLGAGDAFGGALVHGLLSGWEPARMRGVRQRRRCPGRAPAGLRRRHADGGRGRRARSRHRGAHA